MTDARAITYLIQRYRRIAIIGFCALIVVLAAGIPRLQISSDSRAFFGQNDPEYIDVRHLDDTYALPNTILLMAVPPEGKTFEPDTLHTLRKMSEDAWRMPFVLRVDTALNRMHSFSQGDEIFIEPMLDEFAEIDAAAAERFRTLALEDAGLRNTLLSDEGDAFGISVRLVLPQDGRDVRGEIVNAISALRASWATEHPGWDIRATGEILGNRLLGQVAVDDMRTLVPVSFVAAVGLLVLFLGSAYAVAASLLVLACATVATFGFAGWTGISLTAGTVIGPLAVMVLTSTSCTHVILAVIRAHEGGHIAQPLDYALENNLAPVTVSHLTTALGFLCLNFAPSPPLANMGTIIAFGLLVGLLGVFIILPTVLSHRLPRKAGPLMVSGKAMRRFSRWVQGKSGLWLILFPMACAVAVFGISRISYDDNVLRYFDTRYELRQDSEAIQDQLTGLDTLGFSFESGQGNSVFDPAFLGAVDKFEIWLSDQPEVVATSALPALLKDLNQSMSGDDPTAYDLAPTQPGNAQLLMFYELSLPVGLDMNGLMDVDRTQTLLSATVRANTSEDVRALAARAESWLVQNTPEIATRAAGLTIAFARISKRNNTQMLYGFLTALCLISLTLMITLRSLRYGLVSLVPNLIPALLGFGFWGLAVGEVNLGSTVVTTMTFGIVVDDTVHFLMHFMRSKRRSRSTPEALEDTFEFVGSSIAVSSIAMVVGFAIMSASGFAINQHIGLLTAIVIVFALICDLLLLPALLKLLQDKST